MDYLSKIDPNILFPAILAIGGWLYHKARGDKQTTLADTLEGVMRNVLHDLLPLIEADSTEAAIREKVTDLAWKGLTKAGVSHGKIADALVKAAIEHTVADVRDEVRLLGADQRAIDANASEAEAQIPKLVELAKTADDAIAEGRKEIAGPNVTVLGPDDPMPVEAP